MRLSDYGEDFTPFDDDSKPEDVTTTLTVSLGSSWVLDHFLNKDGVPAHVAIATYKLLETENESGGLLDYWWVDDLKELAGADVVVFELEPGIDLSFSLEVIRRVKGNHTGHPDHRFPDEEETIKESKPKNPKLYRTLVDGLDVLRDCCQ